MNHKEKQIKFNLVCAERTRILADAVKSETSKNMKYLGVHYCGTPDSSFFGHFFAGGRTLYAMALIPSGQDSFFSNWNLLEMTDKLRRILPEHDDKTLITISDTNAAVMVGTDDDFGISVFQAGEDAAIDELRAILSGRKFAPAEAAQQEKDRGLGVLRDPDVVQAFITLAEGIDPGKMERVRSYQGHTVSECGGQIGFDMNMYDAADGCVYIVVAAMDAASILEEEMHSCLRRASLRPSLLMYDRLSERTVKIITFSSESIEIAGVLPVWVDGKYCPPNEDTISLSAHTAEDDPAIAEFMAILDGKDIKPATELGKAASLAGRRKEGK